VLQTNVTTIYNTSFSTKLQLSIVVQVVIYIQLVAHCAVVILIGVSEVNIELADAIQFFLISTETLAQVGKLAKLILTQAIV